MASSTDRNTMGADGAAPDLRNQGTVDMTTPYPSSGAEGWTRAAPLAPPSRTGPPLSEPATDRTFSPSQPGESLPVPTRPGDFLSEMPPSPPVFAVSATDTEPAGTPESVDSALRAPDEAPAPTQVPPEEDDTTDTAGDLPDLPDLLDLDPLPPDPPFILYKAGAEFDSAVADLTMWVHGLLLPVYGREVSSMAPWCTRWWEHLEVVAQLYGLWMAWQELTGSKAPLTGPAAWHRDYLMPVMASLRDPSGPFAGCKPGQHRAKEPPPTGQP